MIKRVLKIIVVALVAIVGLYVLVLLVIPSPQLARSKILEAFAGMGETQSVLTKRCAEGTLRAGLSNESLGLPNPYKPVPPVKSVTVRVESPERSLVTTVLEDIYTDMHFWKTLKIPAGAKIVWRGTCEGREFKWSMLETTVPEQHLPRWAKVGKN